MAQAAQLVTLRDLAQAQAAEQERNRRGLDTKTAVLLTFAGVLLGLLGSADQPTASVLEATLLRALAMALAVIAGGLALVDFAPRAWLVLDTTAIADLILDTDAAGATGVVFAELRRINLRNQQELARKSRRLRWCGALLLTAAMVAGTGMLTEVIAAATAVGQ